MTARQRGDQSLADATNHQGDREAWIKIGGNDTVSLAGPYIVRACNQLSACERLFNIKYLGGAAQRTDDQRREWVIVVK